jgi:hypothetical protein
MIDIRMGSFGCGLPIKKKYYMKNGKRIRFQQNYSNTDEGKYG